MLVFYRLERNLTFCGIEVVRGRTAEIHPSVKIRFKQFDHLLIIAHLVHKYCTKLIALGTKNQGLQASR